LASFAVKPQRGGGGGRNNKGQHQFSPPNQNQQGVDSDLSAYPPVGMDSYSMAAGTPVLGSAPMPMMGLNNGNAPPSSYVNNNLNDNQQQQQVFFFRN
jgi:hypothetical protein